MMGHVRLIRGLAPIAVLGLAIALTIAIASPIEAAPEGQISFAAHVTLAPKWLDPAETESAITPFMILYAIHDALVKPMPGGLNTPSLAESWTASIDLKNPDGKALFLRMVEHADVVVENFAPGLMEKLGLDYERLRAVNPRIIMARIKGFGLSGPYHEYKSFDMIAQAMGGVMSVTGFVDREPIRCGAAIGDTGTGVHTAGAIMAAYIQRQRTGQGQLVEVSMQEVIANFLRGRYVDHYRDGKPSERRGNALSGGVPGGAYPCAPGGLNDYVYIYAQPINPEMWRQFAIAIGREDLLTDPRCKDAKTRWEHREELNAIFRAWTGARTKHEVLAVLGKAGVPCGTVLDTGEVLDDPHLNARGQITTIDHPTRGRFRLPGCPVRLSASPAVTTAPPLAGQHTSEVLGEVLGLSKDDVENLLSRGVVA